MKLINCISTIFILTNAIPVTTISTTNISFTFNARPSLVSLGMTPGLHTTVEMINSNGCESKFFLPMAVGMDCAPADFW
jgi:hypothetical protein